MGVLSFLSINPQEGKNPPTPGGFFLPFGFPVGHVTPVVIKHPDSAYTNLFTQLAREISEILDKKNSTNPHENSEA